MLDAQARTRTSKKGDKQQTAPHSDSLAQIQRHQSNIHKKDLISTMSSKKNSRVSTKKGSLQEHSTANTERIHEWITSGNVNTKELSRKLPDIADAIRDGSLKPKDAPKRVEQTMQDKLMATMVEKLGPNFSGVVPITRIQSLELMTGAEPLLCDLVRVACGSDERMSHNFASHFFCAQKRHEKWGSLRDSIDLEGEDDITNFNVPMFSEVQQAYNRTCEYFKREIENLAKKPLEEHVWTYKDNLVCFMVAVVQLIDRSDNYNLEHLCRDMAYTASLGAVPKVKAAALGISNGWDTIRSQCWECGEVAQMYKCTLCKAARYCSKKCQRQSWKSGHKGACAELNVLYERFTANYLRIVQALKLQSEHNETPMHDGCPLAPAGTKDFMLLPMLLSNHMFPVVLSLDLVGCGWTSIDHMYKSLADIVRGDKHWMFDDTFEGSLHELVGNKTSFKTNSFETDYMTQALLFLTVDFSKFPCPEVVNAAMILFKTQLRKNGVLKNGVFHVGEVMSVSRFVTMYYHFGLAERNGFEDASSRWKYMAKTMELMMKHYHKKDGPVDACALREAVFELRELPNE